MPDWIKASLLFFGLLAFCALASVAIAWGMNHSAVWTGVAVGSVLLGGVPTLFYIMLR